MLHDYIPHILLYILIWLIFRFPIVKYANTKHWGAGGIILWVLLKVFFLVLKGFLCFVDPTSSREIEREEPSLTIVTQTRTVKPEEKVEKMPMKRQRRQKTTSDSISKEEEKKVRDDIVLKQSTFTMIMN